MCYMHYGDNDNSNYTQIKGYYMYVVWALGCLKNVLIFAYFEYERVTKIIIELCPLTNKITDVFLYFIALEYSYR